MGALPLIMAAGAAALLLGKKKPKKSSGAAATQSPYGSSPGTGTALPELSTSVKKQGSGYKGVSRGTMQLVQKALFEIGFTVGNFEGIYDAQTKQAVSNFQAQHGGLTVDGKPGKLTRAALMNAAAKGPDGGGQPQPPTQEGEDKPLEVHGADPEMSATYRGYTIQSIYSPGPGGPSDGSGKTFVRIFDPDGFIVHEHTRPWHSSQPQIIAREERTIWGIQYGTYWIDREFARG